LLFEPLPYTVKIIFPMAIPDVELEGEVRRNIFLCFKEALNNVIKHARATAVEMEVNIIKDKLLIRLKDNGAGLTAPSAGETTGNGLKNIRKRMSAINGKFNISNDNGTVVQLELELSGYPNG
jgi:signal transduction histidine kinase